MQLCQITNLKTNHLVTLGEPSFGVDVVEFPMSPAQSLATSIIRTTDWVVPANFFFLVKQLAGSNFLIRTLFLVKQVALGSYHRDGHGYLGFEKFRVILVLSYFLPLIHILITPSR